MSNFIMCYGETSGIFTAKGEEILVDTADLPLLINLKWKGFKRTYGAKCLYASAYIPTANGPRYIAMHRLLLKPNKDEIIDHINQQPLDNRRKNLRITSRAVNNLNSVLYANNTSGYRGVLWSERDRKWNVYIGFNNKTIRIGSFDDREQAAEAYNKKGKALFGDDAYQNKLK